MLPQDNEVVLMYANLLEDAGLSAEARRVRVKLGVAHPSRTLSLRGVGETIRDTGKKIGKTVQGIIVP
jgi:hypothetical protein